MSGDAIAMDDPDHQPASAPSDVVRLQSPQASTSAAAVEMTVSACVPLVNNLTGTCDTNHTIVVHDDHACQSVNPTSDVTQPQSPQASTSLAIELLACAENIGLGLSVTPKIVHVTDISPIPCAPARSGTNNRNKAFQVSCILTSTPHKTLVREKPCRPRPIKKSGPKKLLYNGEEEPHSSIETRGKQSTRANKKQKLIQQDPQRGKGRNITPKRPAKKTRTENSGDDTPCCVCRKRFNEPPRDSWTQCPGCSQWYHDSCGPGDTAYCYFCLD